MSNKLFRWLAFFVFILIIPAAQAQSNLPSNFFLKTLPNGLQVLVIEDHSVPIYTIEIAVKNGSYTESPEFNGLSHLYEHMFFKANKIYPSQEAFIDRTKQLGMVWNGTTSEERVNYFFTTQKGFLHQGIDFMADAIQYPLFSSEEMKKEDVVVDGEFQRQESSPFHFLEDSLNHALWGSLYSRKNVIGDHQIILSATPEKMHVIQNKYYIPNNSLLTIGGDVNHAEIFNLVGKSLAGWKSSGTNPHEKYPEPEFKPLTKNATFIIEKSIAKNAIMTFAWIGPSVRKDPEATYNFDVLSTMLSQNNSALQQKLVQSGLALQVSFSYQTLDHNGPVNLIVVPNPAKIADCYKVVLEELKKLSSPGYFTQSQLEKAKNQLVISDAYEKEQTSSLVHSVSYWWCSASLDYYAGYLANVNKVSLESISHTLDKYVVGKYHVSGMILTPELRKSAQVDSFFKFE